MNTNILKLLKDETIEHKVRFTKKIILFDLFLIFIVFGLEQQYPGSLPVFILFCIVLAKLVLDIRKILFYHVYITNKRLVMVKGVFFKRIMIIHLQKVLYVSHKVGLLDKYFKTGKVRISTTDRMSFTFRGVKYWDHVVNLLHKYGRKEE